MSSFTWLSTWVSSMTCNCLFRRIIQFLRETIETRDNKPKIKEPLMSPFMKEIWTSAISRQSYLYEIISFKWLVRSFPPTLTLQSKTNFNQIITSASSAMLWPEPNVFWCVPSHIGIHNGLLWPLPGWIKITSNVVSLKAGTYCTQTSHTSSWSKCTSTTVHTCLPTFVMQCNQCIQ